MRILAAALSVLAAVALIPDPAVAADAKKSVPYYASISASRARMRTGPARTYPASWLYQRQDLPIKVVAIFKEWRKVADPDGTEGWMQANLLSGTRTAIVHGAGPVELREKPAASGKLLWRAAPGVVGRLSQCGNGWCRFDVKGQAGFVAIGGLWGVEAGETLP
ncbi:SH3-like domain-containing protein [Sphingomonas sp. PP-F2F-A104-K0414]|uniref:SH3 domain-containing protein n=1 Tax=Sphingomonas sp. PP-F2F-A104-K0414 TaxID=2135661 RepID=UPI00104FBE61|nr:SH3 domain-containing protein [Sphingomonas sp. PP-F2F-A104-K0414]TCP99905.1 SH3-like domain-containing protein [Sphingomonas sp. PP-F2F-A104-K0414]